MSTQSEGAVVSAVELYWRPGCPFCMSLRGALHRSGLPVREVNIWTEAGAAARVRQAAGGDETVPTVFVGDRVLINPSRARVEENVRCYAPQLYDQTEPPPRPLSGLVSRLVSRWRR